MARWLTSGRRRDLCFLLHGSDGMRAQTLKTRLQEHYEGRIDPQSFYGALETLESKGHLESRTEGVHDVYELTDGGRQRLEDHVAWLEEQVDLAAVDGN